MSEKTKRQPIPEFQEGRVLMVDKPAGWTSFDVVQKVRGITGVKKVGHAGTLDPMATGLLILCTGRKTKEIYKYQEAEKEYTGTILLGKVTPSDDMDTEPVEEYDVSGISEDKIREECARWQGWVEQLPPRYSAVKVNGKRSYEMARKGEDSDVQLQPREVYIKDFEVEEVQAPYIKFRITCSKGTYIRSIARDVGHNLGVGGTLSELRRTRIGDYRVEDASTLQDLENWVQKTFK